MDVSGRLAAAQGSVPAARAETSEPAPRAIHIDVIATDSRGRGVPNLRASDFELREDGVSRPIDAVRFVTVRPPGADEIPNPVDSDASERIEAADERVRLIGIFLDEYHVAADNTERVRAAVRRLDRKSTRLNSSHLGISYA